MSEPEVPVAPPPVEAPPDISPAFDRVRDALIDEALGQSADAIRLFPGPENLHASLRIDGAWTPESDLPSVLVSRLAESFRRACGLPARGAHSSFALGLFIADWHEAEYDAYVAFLPSRHGPRIAVRLISHAEPVEIFRPEEMLTLL